MFTFGTKVRPGPTMIPANPKRPKLELQSGRSQSMPRALGVVATRNSVNVTSTTKTGLRAAANENHNMIGKTKLPTTQATNSNRALRSQVHPRQSVAVPSNKQSTMPKKDVKKEFVTTKASVAANKPNGNISLAGNVSCRSRLSSSSTGRQWNRNNASTSLARQRNKGMQSSENLLDPQLLPFATAKAAAEMGIQTQEPEILNHSLLVGDIKFLNPSKRVINEIEKQRQDLKTKQMLKATRKFEEHSERQEEHLTDLKEFLEKSYVSKKQSQQSRRLYDSFEDEQKLFQNMDQLLNREIPKTESIADIRARIKRKEEELLNLFDNVENTARSIFNK